MIRYTIKLTKPEVDELHAIINKGSHEYSGQTEPLNPGQTEPVIPVKLSHSFRSN
jgi:hypothetical protein